MAPIRQLGIAPVTLVSGTRNNKKFGRVEIEKSSEDLMHFKTTNEQKSETVTVKLNFRNIYCKLVSFHLTYKKSVQNVTCTFFTMQ